MFKTCVLMLLVVVPLLCIASEKADDPQIGQQWRVKKHLIGARHVTFVEEVHKSILAEDKLGLNQMAEDGELLKMRGGDTLHVLSVQRNQYPQYPSYVECRLIRNNKAVDKVYVEIPLLKICCSKVK